MERPEGILFLCALWFIMGGQPTLYRKMYNIFNMLSLLLFFKMILFSSLISMFLVGKSSRDICGRLVRLSCSPLVYFESVRSGRLVLLTICWSCHLRSIITSGALICWVVGHIILMHTPSYIMRRISQKNCRDSTKGFTGRQYWIRITSALQR